MIPFKEALDIVLGAASLPDAEPCSLISSQGRVLAQDIRSDIDMPPFNKSAVDGFACRMADLAVGTGHTIRPGHAPALRVMETIPAGKVPSHPIGPGQCARIMTGAMVPEGADAVIMVEDTTELPDGTIRFDKEKSAANICYQGEDIRKRDLVLTKGLLISPPEIAVLASVGAVSPMVYNQPKVAVISTGDELVDPGEIPGPARIRNSNSSQLIGQIEQIHLKAMDMGISGDIEEALYQKINEGLGSSNVVIVSGGISMGDYDYVPAVMQKSGVEILFKTIAIQPGRPTVFGRKGDKFVFGLPGNPVSSFVLFELLVKPFLFKLMGHDYHAPETPLPMGETYIRKKSTRRSILPVAIRENHVYPLDYHGSAHIHSYINADGMVAIEVGATKLNKGETVDVRWV
ncbi:MAG: molybdopterin molybdotransferase MoeA [Bacteroidales bacterium]|nr:molybdopterin molybdotransferase MoeA [Bacteroidales bacterium]